MPTLWSLEEALQEEEATSDALELSIVVDVPKGCLSLVKRLPLLALCSDLYVAADPARMFDLLHSRRLKKSSSMTSTACLNAYLVSHVDRYRAT